MRLFRITFKVRPTPQNPGYWEMQFGYLHLVLWDDESHSASARAQTIVSALPFELITPKHVVYDETDLTVEQCDARGWPWYPEKMLNSKRIGFSHFMEGCLVGADEAEFLTAPFPLEPTSES